jgi:hypothetical protein
VAQTLAEPADFAILLLAVTAVSPLQINPESTMIFANQIAKQTRVERLLSKYITMKDWKMSAILLITDA